MIQRRRAVLLLEMLTVILMLGVGGTLLAVAFGSILRSQRRVVEGGNRFAQTDDFFRCFSRDVRKATVARLTPGGGDGVRHVLVIGEPPKQLVYRCYERRVERSAGEGVGSGPRKLWDPLDVEVGIVPAAAGGYGTVVRATVYWRHTDPMDPEPDRRFDRVVRAAGELDYDED